MRGFGFAELLLAVAIYRAIMKRKKLSSSHLYVSPNNIAAIKLYEKFGYARSAVASPDSIHSVVMINTFENIEEVLCHVIKRQISRASCRTFRRSTSRLEERELLDESSPTIVSRSVSPKKLKRRRLAPLPDSPISSRTRHCSKKRRSDS